MEEVLGARRIGGGGGEGTVTSGAHPKGDRWVQTQPPLRGPQGEGPRGGEARGPLRPVWRRFYPGVTRGARANPKGETERQVSGGFLQGREGDPVAGGLCRRSPRVGSGRRQAPGGGCGDGSGRAARPGPRGAGGGEARPGPGCGSRERCRAGGGPETTGRRRSPGPPHSPAGAGPPPPDVPAPRPPPGRAPPPHHFRDALGTSEDSRLGGSAGGSGHADGRKRGVQGDLHGLGPESAVRLDLSVCSMGAG